jgi:hypothetical protein
MALTVSPQVRIVALVGVLAAAGLAVFMFTAGGPSSSVDAGAVRTIKPLYGGKKKVAAHPAAPAKPVATKHVVAPPKAKPAAAKPKPVAPNAPLVTATGLPAVLVRALERHAVVVVALYDPQARVDGISLAEANAGALAAGAGFVPLDVLDGSQAGPLMKQLGVLPDPAVLVYRRPGDLVTRLDGFADRDTVAQAATNAMPADLAQRASAGVALEQWARQASKICASGTVNMPKPGSTTRDAYVRAGNRELAQARATLASIAALPLPTDASARLAATSFLAAAKKVVTLDGRLFDAMKRNDKAALRQAARPFLTAVVQLDATASVAGVAGCGSPS